MPFFSPFGGDAATAGASGAAGGLSGLGGAIGLVGVGLSVAGMIGSMGIEKKEAGVQSNIAQNEIDINNQREQQAQLEWRRANMQNFRATQQAQATGKAAAVNQGGGGGLSSSGYFGGQGQASAQGATNQLGLNQNWQIGQSIFKDTSNIDQDQISMASLQSQDATWKGLSGLGGSLSSSSGKLGSLFGSQG